MISRRPIHSVGVRQIAFGILSLLLVGPPRAQAGAQDAPAQPSFEAPFLAENEVAMNKMMNDMSIRPAGDVDHDFVAMMVPHHQGAVDMAQAELRYGHDEHLRRIAQEIIVEQLQEIAAMRLALGQPLPPPIASPTQPSSTTVPHESETSRGGTTALHPMTMDGGH